MSALEEPKTASQHAIRAAAEIIAPLAQFWNGAWYVPQRQWVKDHPGQVTDGRIGRPVIALGPVSWLPKLLGDEIIALAKIAQEE